MRLLNFSNVGYLEHRFTDDELQFLRDEVNLIKQDFSAHRLKAANTDLAGNLEYEFNLPDARAPLSDLLAPHYKEYEAAFGVCRDIKVCDMNVPVKLQMPWVNFQRKGEFNPTHNHTGVVSFVIYLDVPFNIEDEMNNPSSINSNVNRPAHFGFVYTNSIGTICVHYIPVDKTFRNVMLMFPASLNHMVHPFYTSDEYRISVAGNFVLSPRSF